MNEMVAQLVKTGVRMLWIADLIQSRRSLRGFDHGGSIQVTGAEMSIGCPINSSFTFSGLTTRTLTPVVREVWRLRTPKVRVVFSRTIDPRPLAPKWRVRTWRGGRRFWLMDGRLERAAEPLAYDYFSTLHSAKVAMIRALQLRGWLLESDIGELLDC